MTYELTTAIDIDATPAEVWAVLMDGASYPSWNPFVRKLEGKTAVGERLEIVIGSDGAKPMTIKPTVVRHEPERAFAWLGRLLVPGLFDGEHVFEIEPKPAGGVRFHHREHFRGALLPFLKKMLDTKTRAGFEAMNEALKARCESA